MATVDTFKDFAASLVTSSYKWLTQTLLTAQQQFAVRPYLTCKVVDDTIQPLARLFSGGGNPLNRGGMVTAPDGSVLAAGFDGTGRVVFLKAPDLNAVAGVWPTTVILDSGAALNASVNQVAISCSDWFNGTYHIDVYYFNNLNGDGSNVKIYHQYSNDGGVSWSSNFATVSSMPNTDFPGKNLSIAALQSRNVAGTINSGFVYLKKNTAAFSSGFVGYDLWYKFGDLSSSIGSHAEWSWNDVNSFDWTIQSVTAFYIKNTQYIAFSGFRNIINAPGTNQNFSIWVTALENAQGNTVFDLWSPPTSVMPIGSTSTLNQNQFINPMATVQNGMAYIVVQATLVDSVSQTAQGSSSAVVTTHTNYMLIQSDDGKTFSYPSVLVFTDGTEFNSGSTACFVQQGNYWYLGGSAGYLWQFVQNNIVADITSDVIGYSISEQAGQPSTISLKLGNANNKWVGASPTGAGAAAVARNRKIVLYQGYYNASSVPEVVPRNVYFIDDIQQQVSGTQNDALIVGRDLYKKLKTTVTKFNYQFVGPVFYTDIFDGTTNQNWSITGTGIFFGNALSLYDPSVEPKAILNGFTFNTFGHRMRVFCQANTANLSYVYAMYVDSNNWLRLEITWLTSAWAVKQNLAGSVTTLDNGTFPTALVAGNFYMIMVNRFSYYFFNFLMSPAGGANSNALSTYDPAAQSLLIKNSGTGLYDMSTVVALNSSFQSPFSVGVSASSGLAQAFKNFQLAIFNNSNNVGEISRVFARIAGIFSFKLVKTFRELLFTSTQLNGTFSIVNRILGITAGNTALSSANSMSNGEISFQAKITPTVLATKSGFKFIFRSDSSTSPAAAYYFHLIRDADAASTAAVACRFERLYSGTTYEFYNSAEDVQYNPQFTNTTTIFIDPTIYHTFRVVMIDGQMFAFVDDIMVASWNDDNVTAAYLASGYWGFSADANTTLSVQEITAPILWKPVPSVSFNPGDDAESDMAALATSLLFWFFSDLFGRFKSVFLSSSDPSTYTYNTQLFQQNVDTSDKEYVSQVTVYGNGVSATARNTTLMPGVLVRELVLVDYTILTLTDAQTRANNALINANQYLSQNASKQVINVGAELFDVVTVTNTGNNTSGVNSPTRVYDQAIDQGGGNNNTEYFLEIDTGNV